MARPVEDILLEAYRQQAMGRLAEAELGYRRVLAADACNVHALNLLGIVCLNSARADEAAALITRALAVDASDPEPHANLGLALKELGRLAEAEAALQRALNLQPHNPVALNNLGNVQAEQQRLDDAIASFRAALRIDGNYAPALVNLSAALLAKGQTEGARAAAQRAVELDGAAPQSHNALGDVQLRLTRHEAAATSFSRALTLHAQDVDARIGLSAALKELGDVPRAEALLREAVSLQPQHASALNSLGVLLEQKGDIVGSAAAFRAAIAANPRFANAHYQLAQLKGERLSEAEVAAITALYGEADLPDALRAPAAFALACVAEKAGDHERSLQHLMVGQAINARENPYDDAKVVAYHARLEAAFPTALPPPAHAPQPDLAQPQPVFVLGMPRSGTSLAEQILASHPEVRGAGELGLMEDTISEAARLTATEFPECTARLSTAQRQQLGEFYRQGLIKRTSAARWVVDKTPMNFQYIGFIAAILPGARFIHCQREPMDNCLSIFKLPFESAHAYAHDLDSLGRYYRRYEELMQHWEQVVPGRLITVRYETLVDDLRGQIQLMVALLGLPMHEAMLSFHQTERLVKTPSASQVRQPIYRDSVAAWKRYGDGLRPLAEALRLNP